MPIELSEVGIAILEECNDLAEMLIRKNQDYGNSVYEPIGIFSKASTIDQINTRIDDKLNRLKNSREKNFNEDTEKDLIGYLILRRVFYRVHQNMARREHARTKAGEKGLPEDREK